MGVVRHGPCADGKDAGGSPSVLGDSLPRWRPSAAGQPVGPMVDDVEHLERAVLALRARETLSGKLDEASDVDVIDPLSVPPGAAATAACSRRSARCSSPASLPPPPLLHPIRSSISAARSSTTTGACRSSLVVV